MWINKISPLKRGLWTLVILSNVASAAWFADLMQAVDMRDKTDFAATAAAMHGGQVYRFDGVSGEMATLQAKSYINDLSDKSEFAFLKDAQIQASSDVAAGRVSVNITHAMPTRYLRYFGFPTWPVVSASSVQMNFSKRLSIPTT